jgi:hypothetical protein
MQLGGLGNLQISNYFIGSQIRDLPGSSIALQPAMLPSALTRLQSVDN